MIDNNDVHFSEVYPNITVNSSLYLNEIYANIYKDKDPYQIGKSLEYLYENILDVISISLNEIHGKKYQKDYWRIFLGPWLLHYIHFYYDKVLITDYIREKNIEIIKSSSNYSVPLDTYTFFSLLETDGYNLQGIKNLVREPDEFSQTKYKIENNNFESKFKVLKKSFRRIQKVLNENFLKNKVTYIFDSHFKKRYLIYLLIKSKGLIQPIYFEEQVFFSDNYCKNIRDSLRQVILSNGKNIIESIDTSFFELILSQLHKDIPLIFIENYNEARELVLNTYPRSPKSLFTSTSTHYEDLQKLWMAEAKDSQDVKLIGMQHGGVYGSGEYTWYENHEVNISDIYFTWGWEKAKFKGKIIPLFPQKLMSYKNKENVVLKDKILMVTTNQPRYLFRYPIIPTHMTEYFQELKRFLTEFPDDYSNQLYLRLYHKDFGWDLEGFLENKLQAYNLDENKAFYKSLLESKLFICDHPSTTFLEALYLNKPTILFWNDKNHKINNESMPLFEKLKDVGILHFRADDALVQIKGLLSTDINSWWFSSQVQNVRIEFCERFCKSPDNNDLKKLLKILSE
ncbi:LIC12162 family protein [Mesobacillus subterraneus]|uniref:LIC12162 family transferase n=1 Tax=Mesobacillus subterraneus TaxID=285983 RepID=UPI002040E450|nr:LIC12162 family protein [Mesobacillus subterraneus]MCM3663644.1 LIC12162 family protein [Mesobacillus subterraneus]MCM3683409.1 LIC12162 family protein [Mesobacillus subterraneus]